MAQKHMVTCLRCGVKFDANQGGYYIPASRRYICPACAKTMEKGANGESNVELRISRLILGAVLVLIGLLGIGKFGGGLIALIIAGGTILFGWEIMRYIAEKADEDSKPKVATIVRVAGRSFCSNCGEEIKKGQENCSKCGFRIAQ